MLVVLAIVVTLLAASQASAQYVSFYPTAGDSTEGYPLQGYAVGAGALGPNYQIHPAQYANAAGMSQGYGGSPYEAAIQGDGGYGSGGELCEECLQEHYGGGRRSSGPYQDCACGPRWFNVSVEGLYWKREDVSRLQNFTSDGVAGPIILSTNDLDFDYEPGFRAIARYDVGPSSNIEGSYTGVFNWSTAAQVTDGTNDNQYSILSEYGIDPAGGYPETDAADLQRLEYSTNLNSVDISWRHHWMAPNMRLQGSWLVGARYTNLEETFRYITVADNHNDPLNGGAPRGPGFMTYRTITHNNLIGFQTGGDLYACVLPGLVFGGDVKVGVYGNRAEQDTSILATSINPAQREEATSTEVALIAEGGASIVYQLSPGWSLRAGYSFLFMDGVALAPENFNGAAPFAGGPARPITINSNGNVLYHGPTAGLEWMW